jgi:hypothetical protein
MIRLNHRVYLVLVACITAGVISFMVWPTHSMINAANAAKIQVGMDLQTVETIFGGPARDESTGPLATAESDHDAMGQMDLQFIRAIAESGWGRHLPATWASDSVIIHVTFVDGRAGVPQVVPVRRIHETPWATLRRWLKLP